MNTITVFAIVVAVAWLAILQERAERRTIRDEIKRRIRGL